MGVRVTARYSQATTLWYWPAYLLAGYRSGLVARGELSRLSLSNPRAYPGRIPTARLRPAEGDLPSRWISYVEKRCVLPANDNGARVIRRYGCGIDDRELANKLTDLILSITPNVQDPVVALDLVRRSGIPAQGKYPRGHGAAR